MTSTSICVLFSFVEHFCIIMTAKQAIAKIAIFNFFNRNNQQARAIITRLMYTPHTSASREDEIHDFRINFAASQESRLTRAFRENDTNLILVGAAAESR